MSCINRIRIAAVACLVVMIAPPALAQPFEWALEDGGNGHFYEQFNEPVVTWDEARAMAENMVFRGVRGHLATITSPHETHFLRITVLESGGWIGGHQPDPDAPPDEGWEWITGEEWSYTNWHPGEPNDNGDEYVLEIYETGTWNDDQQNQEGFIVEYPVIACQWDLNDDETVGTGDLLVLLGFWGDDPVGPPDFNGDGVVDAADLIELLGNWGPCPK